MISKDFDRKSIQHQQYSYISSSRRSTEIVELIVCFLYQFAEQIFRPCLLITSFSPFYKNGPFLFNIESMVTGWKRTEWVVTHSVRFFVHFNKHNAYSRNIKTGRFIKDVTCKQGLKLHLHWSKANTSAKVTLVSDGVLKTFNNAILIMVHSHWQRPIRNPWNCIVNRSWSVWTLLYRFTQGIYFSVSTLDSVQIPPP